MICRIWRGYTTPENAGAYQSLLLEVVMPEIAARGMSGYRGFHSLRRDGARGPDGGEEVEFVTMMWFDRASQIEQFVGSDTQVANIPTAARALLKRFDARSTHYRMLTAPDAALTSAAPER